MASATCSGRIRPACGIGRRRDRQQRDFEPSPAERLSGSSTAGCSVTTLMMCRPRAACLAATPLMARLLLSVAPLVKTISLGLRPDGGGDLLPRRVDRLFGRVSEGVRGAGRVAEGLGKVGQHRLQHPGIEPGGGVIVHVDRQL